MRDRPQIGKPAPNFLTVGVYKKKLGKIRLSDYRGKKYVILFSNARKKTLTSMKYAISQRKTLCYFKRNSLLSYFVC